MIKGVLAFRLPFTLERHGFLAFHLADEGIGTLILDKSQARYPVGVEYQSKHLGHEVVEFLALLQVVEVGTIGAGSAVVFHAAGSHFAPGGLIVLVAARAAPFHEFWTIGAVQTAVTYDGGCVFHGVIELKWQM